MTTTRDWNAGSYGRIGGPVHDLGRTLLGRLDLRGDETVLDAGCGTGEVTATLLERLPHGRVIAVDGSPAMVDRARGALDPARATVIASDLLDLELDEPVDVVFSNSTFHWIADHNALFARLAAALRPGGRLLAQCGGDGNVSETVDAIAAAVAGDERFAAHLSGWSPWSFASPPDTRARLERAGFDQVEAGLHTVAVTPDEPREYFRTIMLGAHLERLPAALRDAFVTAVVAELPDPPTIHYVRLTMSAVRAQ
jgi:trans-aconitate 2-methyltransferase